jgi:hypothetical protein
MDRTLVNVYKVENFNFGGTKKNQNLVNVVCERPPKTDFVWYPISDIALAWDYMIRAIPDLGHEPGFQ